MIVVRPNELRAGDEMVGVQLHGARDTVSRRHGKIVAVGIGDHPVAGGECIRLRLRETDPPGYDLNLWNGYEYFDDSLFQVRRRPD